jgi:shikimate kinase
MLVFLIGFMGSGKTTIGKKLANKLSLPFIDIDIEIETTEAMPINQIFISKGESYFREIEHKRLLELLHHKGAVIACGGGTPCFYNNMDLMNSYGKTVYIKLSPEGLYSRLNSNNQSRPLIKDLSETELKDFIKNKLSEREFYYQKSKLITNGLSMNVAQLATTLSLL